MSSNTNKISLVTNFLKSFDNRVVCLDRLTEWGTTSGAVTKELVAYILRISFC